MLFGGLWIAMVKESACEVRRGASLDCRRGSCRGSKEQTFLSTKEVTDAKAQVEKPSQQVANHAPLNELRLSTAALKSNVSRILDANTAATASLGASRLQVGHGG